MKLSDFKNVDLPVGMASYLVITEHQKRTGSPPSGLYFNKMLSLLHLELKEQGTDIHLPHCWYRHGDEVVRFQMPYDIRWNHEEEAKTTVSWSGDMPRSLGDDSFSVELKNAVVGLLDRYLVPGGLENAVEEVYRRAPFEFQRKFRIYRKRLWVSRLREESASAEAHLFSLREACDAFPAAEFPEVNAHVPSFLAAMNEIYTSPAPDYALAEEMSAEFWNWFCYFLRLHPDCHENTLRDTTEHWESGLEWHAGEYGDMFADHVVQLSEENVRLSQHPVLGPIIAGRKKDSDDFRALLDSSKDDFKGFDDYLKKVKGGFKPGI